MSSSASDGIGGGLPPQDAGNSGKFLTTTTSGNLSTASWASVGGGGGVTTVGAFGSSPTANAMSISGVTLTGQPADGTHPGFLTSGTQAIGGAKTFAALVTGSLGFTATSGNITATAGNVSSVNGTALESTIGLPATADFPGLWLGIAVGAEAYGNCTLLGGAGLGVTVLNGNAWPVSIRISNGEIAKFNATNLDLTGMGVGGVIKLKSPDGTTYSLSIANGGTVNIV